MTTPTTLTSVARAAALSAICLAAAQAAPAQDDPNAVRLQGWAFVMENDLLGTANAKDRWFTNGAQLMLAYEPGHEPALLRPTLSWGRWLLPDDCEPGSCGLTLNTSLGQNIYTPRAIDVAQPQPNDRPWAGWLYGGMGLSSFSGHRHQVLALKAGPTGPASLAEGTQEAAHCCLGSSKEPAGWANQLRPRLGVQLSYQSTHFHFADGPLGLQTSWGGMVGNVRTLLRGALAATWSPARGQRPPLLAGNLDEGEFFTPDFRALALNGTVADSLRHTLFFAHLQVSAVAYNAFLQGRTYAGHSQIDPERLVGTSTLGFAVPLGARGQHKISMAWKRRTPEFKVQGSASNLDGYQSWGVLSYSQDY